MRATVRGHGFKAERVQLHRDRSDYDQCDGDGLLVKAVKEIEKEEFDDAAKKQ